MALLPILQYPDERLHRVAQPVTRVDEKIQQIIKDMAETMYAAPGIGLAATQVDIALRIVVIDSSPSHDQLLTLINPQLISQSGVSEFEEGCLSVPGMRGLVPRFLKLRYQGFDETGKKIDRTVSDFHARVVQHEVDHLDGILYPMRMDDLSLLVFESEFERFNEDAGPVD